jgi:hypothetical protein
MGVKNIFYKKKLIAQKFNFAKITETTFPTPPECEFQLGIGIVNDNKIFESHTHKTVKRTIKNTSEFIYVIAGKMSIEILVNNHKHLETLEIKKNEGFLQYFGGHKIKASSQTRYFEIKQGPYFGRDIDKCILIK